MIKKMGQQIYIFIILIFLYAPIFLLVFYSFNDSRFSSEWHHFSWRWFSALFRDEILLESLRNSLILAISSSFIATMISVVSCTLLIVNSAEKTLRVFLIMPSFLIILPDLILGVGFLVILNILNIPFGFISLLIAPVTFILPFILFTIITKLYGFNRHLYFAALDLGASKLKTWKKIILPLLFPSIASAFLLGFILSFDDVIISYFVAGPEFNILPLTILGIIRSGATPELNALCTLTLVISFLFIILTQMKLRKS